MVKELLIGIDVGTTSTKSVLVDSRGAVLAQAAKEYPTLYPSPGWAEQNPDEWWRAIRETVQALFHSTRYSPQDVAAVGVSSQAPTLVPLDKHGIPLHAAIIWMDRRSEPQCAWLRKQTGVSRFTEINGGRIDPFFLLPKLLWYQRERPELHAQTDVVLQANGYIIHRLTHARSMDRSHGALTLLFDSENESWSDELFAISQADRSVLPPVVSCTEIVGEVTRTAAAATGLAAGTPVIAGMVDGTAASLEASVIQPGDAVEMTGQTTVLLICSDHAYLGDALFPLGHAIPSKHLLVGAQVATGGSLRWFRDQLGVEEVAEAAMLGIDPFELLSAIAATSPPGANRLVFLPYMYGERSPIWDSNARGVAFGLSLATTKADIVRAILEGAAMGLRHNMDAAAEAGIPVKQVRCVGGGSKSDVWNQIKADVLNLSVHVPQAATGAPLGGAIAAAAAVGLYPNVEAAVLSMTVAGKEFLPDPKHVALYDELYDVYLGLYPALRDSFTALAAIRTTEDSDKSDDREHSLEHQR